MAIKVSPYYRPSPWEKFPQAMQAIVEPIQQLQERRKWHHDTGALKQLRPQEVMGSGGPLTQPAKSPQDLLPMMKSQQGKELLMRMILSPAQGKQTTVLSPQGEVAGQYPGTVQVLPQQKPFSVAPGHLYGYPGQNLQQAPAAPMSPYQEGQLQQGQQRLALEDRRVQVAEMNAQSDAKYRNFQMSKEGGVTGRTKQLMSLAGIFGIKPTRNNLAGLNQQFFSTNSDFERFALNQAVELSKNALDWDNLSPEEKMGRLMEHKNLIINNYAGERATPGQGGSLQGWTPSQGPKPTKEGHLPSWW